MRPNSAANREPRTPRATAGIGSGAPVRSFSRTRLSSAAILHGQDHWAGTPEVCSAVAAP